MRTIKTKTRRDGVTLTEALIAVGIMAIGLLALLTFFPLAAIQMARSFKDDRTGSLARNAENLFSVYWRDVWTNARSTSLARRSIYEVIHPNTEPGFQAFYDPNANYIIQSPAFDDWFIGRPPHTQIPAVRNNDALPSFPVMIDPVGFALQPGNARSWVVGSSNQAAPSAGHNYIARRTLNQFPTQFGLSTSAKTTRMTTLLDDVTFAETGVPDLATGAVERAGKYNCAWVLQRPVQKNAYDVNMWLLTFQGRPSTDIASIEDVASIVYPLAPTDTPGLTPGVSGSFIPSPANSITVTYNGSSLPIYKGEWIIAVNMYNAAPSSQATEPNFSVSQGASVLYPWTVDTRRFISFHRVLSIVEGSGPNLFELELQQPLQPAIAKFQDPKDPTMPSPTTPGQAVPKYKSMYPSHIIMFQGLVEVFDVPPLSLTNNLRQP